jgi:hypothetical protein
MFLFCLKGVKVEVWIGGILIVWGLRGLDEVIGGWVEVGVGGFGWGGKWLRKLGKIFGKIRVLVMDLGRGCNGGYKIRGINLVEGLGVLWFGFEGWCLGSGRLVVFWGGGGGWRVGWGRGGMGIWGGGVGVGSGGVLW